MNNLDPLEKIFSNSNKVTLDPKKKEDIRREVLQFMKNNPIKEPGILMRWFSFRTPVVALAGMLLFLGIGSIASVQANGALPGDFLYPMKVGVNEKIEEVLAFSDQAKLKLNIKLTEVRLKEAEQLIATNKMDGQREAKVRTDAKDRANKASLYIDKLDKAKYRDTKQDDELKNTTDHFEASLKAQGTIFNDLKKRPDSKVTDSFIKDVDDITSKISEKILERKAKKLEHLDNLLEDR